MFKKFLVLSLAAMIGSSFLISAADISVDQTPLKNSQKLKTIYRFHQLDHSVSYADQGLTEYSLFSERAGQTWKMELYDFSRVVGASYHKIQNEMMLVLEGEILLGVDDQEVTLLPGQFGVIAAGSIHVLTAGQEGTRFLLFHVPGFDYPKDRNYEKPAPEVVNKLEAGENGLSVFIDQTLTLPPEYQEKLDQFLPLDPKYYQAKVAQNECTTYSIISAEASDFRWSLDILEMKSTDFKKVDLQGTSRFIVMNGELKVLINGKECLLKAGQSIRVSPEVTLAYAAGTHLVRVLCVTHF